VRISVIIPAYNAELYIARAIESCLRQTEPADEIIVADDGSTDRTGEIAGQFSDRVRIVRLKENCGLPVARNRAVEASTGDWLAFLDADDWFFPQKLQLQRRCIRENPDAVLVYSGFRLRFIDGSERDGTFISPGDLHWRLRYHGAFHVGSVMLRRDAFDAVGGFNPSYRRCEDWDLWLRIANRFSTAAFAVVPEPLVAYRQVPESLSSDAMRMFEMKAVLIESRSLYGKSGLNRLLLRRQIHAFNHYDTAIAVREQGSKQFLRLMFRSFVLWPFPNKMLPLNRYKTAVVMLMQYLGWWRNSAQVSQDEASITSMTSDKQGDELPSTR